MEQPDGSVPFKGDGIMLQAALHNIVDNAIKYSPEDSDISVRLEANTTLRLSVTDQGRGFGDMDLESLTGRYSRGVNVGDVVGSGLGLTIADEVARAHGGQLELSHNMEGQGACVSLILPYV
jgi:two-component system sensor histidine kinase TctE